MFGISSFFSSSSCWYFDTIKRHFRVASIFVRVLRSWGSSSRSTFYILMCVRRFIRRWWCSFFVGGFPISSRSLACMGTCSSHMECCTVLNGCFCLLTGSSLWLSDPSLSFRFCSPPWNHVFALSCWTVGWSWVCSVSLQFLGSPHFPHLRLSTPSLSLLVRFLCDRIRSPRILLYDRKEIAS